MESKGIGLYIGTRVPSSDRNPCQPVNARIHAFCTPCVASPCVSASNSEEGIDNVPGTAHQVPQMQFYP